MHNLSVVWELFTILSDQGVQYLPRGPGEPGGPTYPGVITVRFEIKEKKRNLHPLYSS